MIMQKVKLSSNFKIQVFKTIFLVILFIITYSLLFLSTIGLIIGSFYAAYYMLDILVNFLTIILSIGSIGVGLLIFVFLIKFVFHLKKTPTGHLIKIERKDQPKLFDLLDELAAEINVSFPKNVYLTPDVNASVFYTSSFWSMFLPNSKNLTIGLGLVNSSTETEFKAVLAHEFGHFSDKNMRIISYVFNINKIIYNMLYVNDAYEEVTSGWKDWDSLLSSFVVLSSEVVKGIQWVVDKIYLSMNKAYLGLRREQEFYADEIAVNITGYRPFKNALLKTVIAGEAFSTTISFYRSKALHDIIPKNIYLDHAFMIKFLERKNEIPIEDGVPKIVFSDIIKYNKSKLHIEDQWSSHPTIAERIESLEKTKLETKEYNTNTSWNFFENVKGIQEEMTRFFFTDIRYKESAEFNTLENFKEVVKEEFSRISFPKVYKGFYQLKNPVVFDLDQNLVSESELISIEELFNKQTVNETFILASLKEDIDTIKHIQSGIPQVKSFDYNGKKYNVKSASALLKKLLVELQLKEEKERENDKLIYSFFYKKSREKGKEKKLVDAYEKYFYHHKEYDNRMQVYERLIVDTQFINDVVPYEEINAKLSKIKPIEDKLKENIKEILYNPDFKEAFGKHVKKDLESYLSKQWEYFSGENYIEDSLEIFFTALDCYQYLVAEVCFLSKKRLLDFKASLI